MSGGHFEYAQYHIGEIADSIEELVRTNDSTEKDEEALSGGGGWHVMFAIIGK